MRFKASKHICSINLNVLPELKGFTARETFYKIAATYVKVVVTDLCLEKIFFFFLSGDDNDYVVGYNNRTSGMKPVFRLFCVAVNILQTEACGS